MSKLIADSSRYDSLPGRDQSIVAVRGTIGGVTEGPRALARAATSADAAAIARIYNEGIADRIATFETEPRNIADIEHLLAERAGRYPTVVVERLGEVVAWASAGTYRSRACYDQIAEHSVYVGRAHRGTGVGRIALEALIEH